jgi:hypothetical protein
MAIAAGKHELSPDSAVLMVKTKKGGAASKAGHDLLLGVTRWNATLDLGDEPSIDLTADASSLCVIQGSGGMMALGDEEKSAIEQTIGEEVLTDGAIRFQSSEVDVSGDGRTMHAKGDLELAGKRHPIDFELEAADDGHLTGSAVVKQTDWGIKPYSALFGTLKVQDEVEIVVNAKLPTERRDADG